MPITNVTYLTSRRHGSRQQTDSKPGARQETSIPDALADLQISGCKRFASMSRDADKKAPAETGALIKHNAITVG
jgi:hypothetical protein